MIAADESPVHRRDRRGWASPALRLARSSRIQGPQPNPHLHIVPLRARPDVRSQHVAEVLGGGEQLALDVFELCVRRTTVELLA